jgi:hypothetical protein
MSAFEGIAAAITAVRHVLEKDVRDVFRPCRLIDDDLLRQLREAMVTATGDPRAAEAIVEEIARTVRGRHASCDRLMRLAKRAARREIGPHKGDKGHEKGVDGGPPEGS